MPITPVDPPANGDTAQRFFASLAPGAKPFEPGAPAPDYLEAPTGDQPPMAYFAPRIPIPGIKETYQPKPDQLDAVLMRAAEPQLFQQQAEFMGSGPKPVVPGMDFWDSVKTGFNNESLAGLFLNHQRLKAEVEALPGELQPVPGYDALRDDRKRIADAGLEGELWSFRDSTSPNETTFRIWQFQQRQRDAQLAQRAGGMGMFLGSLLDPINLLPIGAGGAATKGVWGTFWRGARVASINASQALAQEGLKAEIDVSYRNQGIMDALEIPAALGFAVGVIHARTAAHPNVFKPDPPKRSPDTPVTPPEREDFTGWKSTNKVPDAQDGVLRVYHGTTQTYERFDSAKMGSVTGQPDSMEGFFFAGRPGVTDSYAMHDGGQVRPAYIRMENPKVIDLVEGGPGISFADEISKAKAAGHDGLTVRTATGDNTYVVFDTKNIKNFDERFNVTPEDILRTAPSHPLDANSGRPVTDATPVRADSNLDGMLVRENHADRMTAAVQELNRLRDELDVAEAAGRGADDLKTLRAKFDAAQRHLDEVAGELDSGTGIKRDASSGAVIYDADRQLFIPGEGLKPTGTGIEKWGINPAIRMLNSMTYAARKYVTELVDLGGMKQLKNMGEYGSPTSVPLEAEIARIWKPKAITALHEMQQAWLEARGVASDSMSGVAWQGMKMQTRDWVSRETGLTWAEFDRRVAMAMRRGDADHIFDEYSPFVNKAAASVRKFHEDLRVAGMDPNVDIFGKANRRLLEKLNKEVAALRAKGLDSAQAEARLQKAIDHINKTGTQSTAVSYFTRYWNVDALLKGKDTFLAKVEGYFIRSGVEPGEAKKSALNVYKTLTRNEFRTIQAEADDIAEQAIDPMSAKMRSLQIPDTEIEEFLESSATLSVRHQLATFAPAIEMTRRFGDTSLKAQIDSIKAEYKTMHDAAATKGDAPLMTKIEREAKQVEEDIKTLRDRLLNVAGASADPHSWDQRTIRMLKHYMTWTTMGLSAFSQLGDLVRPAITEGLDAMHRYGFASLISDSRNTIFKMAQRERFLAGDSLEVVLASKAMAASDIGDVFASRSNFERKAGNFTNAFYMLNGMNHAVDLSKTWASVIVQSNINDAIYQWGMHMLDPAANKAPSALMMERLKSLSIDGSSAMRIAKELAGKGIEFKSVHLANTEAWTDAGARDLYRQALQRALQRTVVTPGLGDKPTWMSTPLGSLIGQFKSFGMSSTIRTLYAGLQDKDRNFFMGAAVLVGAGIVLNEIRSQLFSDRTSLNQPYLGILMDGVDRSGVLGSFTDINNALEAASNNKIGARPLLGAGKKYPVTGDRLANAFLGPTAGKAALAADTLGRIVNGDPTAKTMRQVRQFVPGQNWAPVKLAETAIY